MNKLPLSRSKDIVVQEAGSHLLVYDLVTHNAYNLNETSRIIFESCNGRTSFDELKRKYQFPDELVYFALDELNSGNLISGQYRSIFAGISRRQVIRQVGLATMIALPLISSIVAPRAAAAQSEPPAANGESCSVSSQCQSNLCSSGTCCSGSNPGVTSCTSNVDCCFTPQLRCLLGVCCVTATRPCDNSSQCCPGLICVREFPGSDIFFCKGS